MATMTELRTQAREKGIPVSKIRSASTAAELEALLNGSGSKPVRKKAVATAVKKKTATVAKKTTGAKRGRPKGSTNKVSTTAKAGTKKNSSASTKTPAKTAKRSSTATDTVGRHMLSGIDFGPHDDWKPRDGSSPDRIIKAARKFKGDRTKIYDALVEDVWDFTSKVKITGEKRTIVEARQMLKYRIAQTLWQFAMKTGQHKKSTKRAEYGSVKPTVYVKGFGGRASHLAPKSKRPKTQASAPAKSSKPARKAPAASGGTKKRVASRKKA